MKRVASSLIFFVLIAPTLFAQLDKIVIAAGTDEDKDLQTISNEPDVQKKVGMYQDFVKKYSANAAAVAYGNWQLSQSYQATGDLSKALDYGDKALAGSPHNLDILVSQASLAQQAKDNTKLMDYVAKGGTVCGSLTGDDKTASQSNCDFLETTGFNVIAGENDGKRRMAAIEQYTAAFPASKFGDQVSSYAMYTLGPGQLNDPARLVAYGEKTLAANPNSTMALLLLANFYTDDAKPDSPAKAASYAKKAVDVAKPTADDADNARKLSGGVAYSTLGYAELKQNKLQAAVPDLKSAITLLKDRDQQQYSFALYRLGVVYAKLNRIGDAHDVLTEAVKIAGPAQAPSQDLLTKVNAARAKGAK